MAARRRGADPARMIKGLRRLNKVMPNIAGRIAVNGFKETFRRGGWTDRRLVKWKDRKGNIDQGRAVLVKSGRLKRSLRVLRKRTGQVETGTDLAYGAAHNEGAKIKGRFRIRTHSRTLPSGKTTQVQEHNRNVDTTLPQRQFVGESKKIIDDIEVSYIRRIKKIIR